MSEQERMLDAIAAADIRQDDWEQILLGTVLNDYARGYLKAKIESAWGSMSPGDEEFRQYFMNWVRYDSIWTN